MEGVPTNTKDGYGIGLLDVSYENARFEWSFWTAYNHRMKFKVLCATDE